MASTSTRRSVAHEGVKARTLEPPGRSSACSSRGEVVPMSARRGEARLAHATRCRARFGVAVSTIAAFAKEHRTTERREELRAQLDPKARRRRRSRRSVKRPAQRRRARERRGQRTTENTAPSDERRRPSRPRHQQAPVIPFRALDRLLVFGEVSMNDDGTSNTVYRRPPRAG